MQLSIFLFNVNFNSTKQTSQQKPAFGVRYNFRAKDLSQLGLYLTHNDTKTRKFYSGLLDCIEQHNANESLHAGQLNGTAAMLDIKSEGIMPYDSKKWGLEVGDVRENQPYKMFFAYGEFKDKMVNVRKIFKEINAKICSDRLGVSVEQKVTKNFKPYQDTLPEQIELMSRIRALSDEHVK